MRKFNFPLQFLLEYRERKEKQLKRELAEIIKKWRKERKLLEGLKKEEMKCQGELRKRRECGKVEIPYVLLYQSYLEELARKIEKEEMKVRKLYAMMEKKREELTDASKEKKTVERLKRKRWLEFVNYMEKREQEMIDESAIAKFNLQKRT